MRTWTGPYLVCITAPVMVRGFVERLEGECDAPGLLLAVGPGVVGARAAGRLVGWAPCDLKLSKKTRPVTVATTAMTVRRIGIPPRTRTVRREYDWERPSPRATP